MAKETKTVQCYPDDSIINDKIKEYEAFGWELISNQRCQEYDGQTRSRDIFNGSTTVTSHYSTFNKLTFSREKSASWYSKIIQMESEYHSLMNTKPQRPKSKSKIGIAPWYALGVIGIALGILFGSLFGGSSWLAAVVGAFALCVGIGKTVYSKKNDRNYYSALYSWKSNSGKKAEELLEKAERLVNGLAK